MENKTADFQKEQFETQQSVHYWAGRLIGHEQAYHIAEEIVEAITYASLQCADMKKELEIVNGCRTSAKSCLPMIVGKYDQLTERSELSLEQKLTQLVYNTIVDAAYKEEEHETTTTKIINIITTFNQCAEMKKENERLNNVISEVVAANKNLAAALDEWRNIAFDLQKHINELPHDTINKP